MATLTIRKLDDAIYDRLKAQARGNHRSIEAEVRHMIDERLGSAAAAQPHRGEEERVKAVAAFLKTVEDLHARSTAKPGRLLDSTAMIREMRDEE